MNSYILPVFFFSIWNIILFYKKSLGISVILFIVPFTIFWFLMLYKNKKVYNKKGFLLIIPILLLSSTYFLYDNFLFKWLNTLVVPFLFTMMNIYILDGLKTTKEGIKNICKFLIEPVNYLHSALEEVRKCIKSKLKIEKESKKKIESILIILPILLIVILLLSSADIIFKSIFENILDFSLASLSIVVDNFYWKMVMFLLFFIYVISTIYYLLFYYDQEKKREEKRKETPKESYPINILLVSLNIIYILFDILQIKSLIFHSVSASINYAEYARKGFFQLMFVSLINISILLVTKKYKEKEKAKNIFINKMSTLMVFLTFIIILSSFLRMNLYEAQYGYTVLRLLVYITLCTEVILLIPTLFYIWNPNIKIGKYYVTIILIIYTAINFINMDKRIALRNIERYRRKNDIDIEYLENNHTDNIKTLLSFYEEVEDKKIKSSLKKYFANFKIDENQLGEWNITKRKATKALTNIKK